MARTELETFMAERHVTIEARFVPWAQSRSVKPRPTLSDRSLNWYITVFVAGRPVHSFDYSAGIGHCPSYSHSARPTLDYAERIAFETERGYAYRAGFNGKKIEPDTCSVLASLALDVDALNYATFEQWAEACGFSTDSRSAEQVYKACLSTGLALRSALGEAGLNALHTAAQDF
jgi:hypothetical protein